MPALRAQQAGRLCFLNAFAFLPIDSGIFRSYACNFRKFQAPKMLSQRMPNAYLSPSREDAEFHLLQEHRRNA